MTAALCHDTNHSGLNNQFNLKAETPLGILYKESSVMEMHHVSESIPVISRNDIDLFRAFDHQGKIKAWKLFIHIILATDMAKHFDLVKRAQAAVDAKNFNFATDEQRLLGLELLIKVGDISNVARPFEIADKWCDILNEEFFHQGDLEKETGIGFTAPLNDRANANKPKSQVGFYTFVCIPLYTVIAGIYPPIGVLLESVKDNLAKWKRLAQPTV
jgi:hypothetical protein